MDNESIKNQLTIDQSNSSRCSIPPIHLPQLVRDGATYKKYSLTKINYLTTGIDCKKGLACTLKQTASINSNNMIIV